MSKVKIKINDLYKIFGPKGESHVEKVKSGMGKPELLEKHSHVLGLQNINLDIIEGKIQVIMGLSGSGKSTLIRHINRLIEPTAGQIYIDDVDVLAMSDEELMNFRRFKASMVFQKFALLPHRTVLANTIYGLTMQGVEVKDAEERAAHWLKRVGLDGFEDRYPAQLSGGMQQRVGLARALATDADILLMDEAFSALELAVTFPRFPKLSFLVTTLALDGVEILTSSSFMFVYGRVTKSKSTLLFSTSYLNLPSALVMYIPPLIMLLYINSLAYFSTFFS